MVRMSPLAWIALMLRSADRSLKRTMLEMRMDRFLVLLCLSAGGRDGPGREAGEMSSEDLPIAEELVRVGLARRDEGWRKSRWYRLTAEAWDALGEHVA